jgi:predicted alpha/beta-fold hydrolase
VLYFKKTAYNWLNFCREMPPCYEGSRRVSHTQFDAVYFPDPETRDIAGLAFNGKLLMIFWFVVGDDFHVTKWNFSDFPTDFSTLSEQQRTKLLAFAPKLEQAMEAAVQFKLNAGRRVGNFNLAKCRSVTDQGDLILAEALGFADVWEDIELYYAQTMKTDFSDDED